jgi:serine/threonine protein kinase
VIAKAEGSSPLGYVEGQPITQRYSLERCLATKESGEVWVASDRSTGETVAIKLVQASGPAASHFRREAELSATLVHPNIVRVLGSFERSDGTLGLVMEYLRGETARERIHRTGPLSPRAAVHLVTQALAGLAHAHGQSIVHRDLKPSNLFLSSDPEGRTTAKIHHFGTAYTDSNTIQTLQGQMVGTPHYMSPEQIRATDVLDGRSDLFSLGTVLYELLTGKCPFAASFQMGSIAAVLEARVERHERIPPALWEVIAQTLSKKRDARPATASELATALRAAVEADDPAPSRAVPRSAAPPPLLVEENLEPIVFPTPPAPKPSLPRSRVRERAIFLVVGLTGISLAILAVAALRVPRSRRTASAPAEAPALVAPSSGEPPAVPEVARPPSTSTTASSAPSASAPLAHTPAADPEPVPTGAAPATRAPRTQKEPPLPIVHDAGF